MDAGMQRATTQTEGEIRYGLSLQLLLSHIVAAATTVTLYLALGHSGWSQPGSLIVALALGGLIGLLCTVNIQYGLYLINIALARFAQGATLEPPNLRWQWPLTSFFAILNAANRRMESFERQAQLTGEYREQLLHQTAEAAAIEERNRIARDLHDSIKQQIFSISISAAAAKALWHNAAKTANSASETEEDVREAVEDIQRSAKEAQVEMQALLQQLRGTPLENTSLTDALNTQAQALGYRTGAQVQVEITALPSADRLLPGAQEAIFRMVQEAFANIARHARASNVWLSLYQRDGAMHIEIRDDGQGFDLKTVRRGMGLNNFQERAATLGGSADMQSAVGEGTHIYVTIPLLDALPSPQERERRAHILQRITEQASWGFQLSELAAPFVIGLIIASVFSSQVLSVSTVGLLICILAMCYGYVQGWYMTARVVVMTGHQSRETLMLRSREHGVRLWFWRTLSAAIWYLFLAVHGWLSWPLWLTAIGMFLILLVLFIVAQRKQHRLKDAYYHLLPEDDLRWEVLQQRRSVVRRGRIIGGIALVLLVNIALHIKQILPSVTLVSWSTILGTLLLFTWFVLLWPDYQFLRKWTR